MMFCQIDEKTCVIVDWKYYAENLDTIDGWCKENLGYWARTGMVMQFYNNQDLVVFFLRWNS
jgi:hypothetical protein